MAVRLEFGWVRDDGRYICDGCNVRDGHEHRCSGDDGAWQDGRSCECEDCKEPTEAEMEAFRRRLEADIDAMSAHGGTSDTALGRA